MNPTHTAEEKFDCLSETLEKLRAAYRANNASGARYWSNQLAGVSRGLAEDLQGQVLPPHTMTSLQSKEACVRQPAEPLGDEAILVLMVIANGLSQALNCHLFCKWLTMADVTGLSLAEIRQRFEQAHSGRYLPKSVIARLLAEAGRSHRS